MGNDYSPIRAWSMGSTVMVVPGGRRWYASYHPRPAERGTTLLLAFAASPMTVNERVLEDAPLARGAETYAAFALIYCEMDDPPPGSAPSAAAMCSRIGSAHVLADHRGRRLLNRRTAASFVAQCGRDSCIRQWDGTVSSHPYQRH